MKNKMHIRDDRYNLESFVCIFLYEVFFALAYIYIYIKLSALGYLGYLCKKDKNGFTI